MKEKLSGVRVAVLAATGFEQVELTIPVSRLRKAGADITIVSLRPGNIRGVNLIFPGKKVTVDESLVTADAADFDALFIPGGFANPDFLRQDMRALQFASSFEHAGKPIASLCHGPWVLISARLVEGRRLASWPGIADDVRNAGGFWEDAPVVRDGNWITSRSPLDLPLFVPAMINHFADRVLVRAPVKAQRRWPRRLAAAAGIAAAAFTTRQLALAAR